MFATIMALTVSNIILASLLFVVFASDQLISIEAPSTGGVSDKG